MKIHDLKSSKKDGLARVSATITWEDCDRPQRELYIETTERFADDLSCNPHTFLLSAIMPAMHHGERRVLIDGAVCPQLRNGLVTAMQQIRQWYSHPQSQLVEIEATKGFEPPLPRLPQRTASFMSGGVDALATLRCNRLDFPLDHPGSIQDCFFVHGIDIGGYEHLDNNKANFELSAASLSGVAEDAKVTLIPVYINLRHLDDSDWLFGMKSHGAIISGIAHAFSRRITTALIASSYDIADMIPWGSHPLLDSNYSSFDVCIRHDGVRFSRIEKMELIADWDAALKTLRSCYQPLRPGNVINCGKCEKCIRTMTTLVAVGKLAECPTFPLDDISPDLLKTFRAFPSKNQSTDREQSIRASPLVINRQFWPQLVEPLRRIGRDDLAKVIETKLKESDRYRLRGYYKNIMKGFDQKYLSGRLLRMNQRRKEGRK